MGFINNFKKSIIQNESNQKFVHEFKNQLSLGGNLISSRNLMKEDKNEEQKKKNLENSQNNENKNNKKKKKKE